MYSQPVGTVIPGADDIGQICVTGYQASDDGVASTTKVCSYGNKNTNPYQTGMATSANCPVTITPVKGDPFAATLLKPSVCGYNQDALYYCQWQLGDPIPAAAFQALTPIFAYAAANCNPQ